jgi:hypothetical protein
MVAVFTVYFEDPFWVGLLESEDSGSLVVARQVFGAEPSNAELLDFMLYRFASMRRAPSSAGGEGRPAPRLQAERMNPKRSQREARRDMRRPASTKAQAALASAQEELKASRACLSREEAAAEDARRFALASEKRKRKRAGH